jgi:hypothetical protein
MNDSSNAEQRMIREVAVGTCRCSCGFEMNFFENTILDLKQMSKKKRQVLQADDRKDELVFSNGNATEIRCPTEHRKMK